MGSVAGASSASSSRGRNGVTVASPRPTGTSGGSSTTGGAGSFSRTVFSSARPAASRFGRRVYHQLAIQAATAAATPTSSAATNPTCQAEGPTSVRRWAPSDPPANPARAEHRIPVVTPHTNPHNGAASLTTSGALRWVSTPPIAPATNGTANAANDNTGAAPLAGKAANIGNAGNASTDTPVGDTVVSVPIANPGPNA